MRVLITGGVSGQLRNELIDTLPDAMELLDPGFTAGDGATRLDISDAAEVAASVDRLRPDLILNAAAYTAVDRAESERAIAFGVNADGVAHLADAALACGARLVHVSTDFVFGGERTASGSRPYAVSATPSPLGVYGESKLAGEHALAERLPAGACTIRTSWVYSTYGNNFVKTMLRLMNERDEIGVVADQVGSPTWARSLAKAAWRAAELELDGILHWSDAGVASWYDLAVAILDEGQALGLIDRQPRILPLTTEQYPTIAARPAYSVLDTSESRERLGLPAEHWRHTLRAMLGEIS